MTRDSILNEYFDWLYNLVCEERFAKELSYRKLLIRLHDTEFRYLIAADQNRADDGMELRYRFAMAQGYEYDVDLAIAFLEGPCSVLEMMVALAIRCERNIMDDTRYGDRTGQWFWGMVTNLGLGSMYDSRFDRQRVDTILARFLDREYDPDGKGGLFTVRNCRRDLTHVEIWYQLCWYLDSIM